MAGRDGEGGMSRALLIALGAVGLLLVLSIEMVFIHKDMNDYKASIVRETVAALRGAR